jgi:hypothetical protein
MSDIAIKHLEALLASHVNAAGAHCKHKPKPGEPPK